MFFLAAETRSPLDVSTCVSCLPGYRSRQCDCQRESSVPMFPNLNLLFLAKNSENAQIQLRLPTATNLYAYVHTQGKAIFYPAYCLNLEKNFNSEKKRRPIAKSPSIQLEYTALVVVIKFWPTQGVRCACFVKLDLSPVCQGPQVWV